MKCPKCSYLGFETGDRCKNCGYDFSLVAQAGGPDEVEVDLTLRLDASDLAASSRWLDEVDLRQTPGDVTSPIPPSGPVVREAAVAEERLPLFAPDGDPDEPLIRLPAAPRPPLAVRRTPATPRLRAVPRPAHRAEPEPVLQFTEETGAADVLEPDAEADAAGAEPLTASPGGARATAGAIDLGILLAVDAAVVYFTLRMAGLPVAAWPLLPAVPLLAFLLLLKLAYFAAFTAVGGQTIGKMAAGIRVVTDEGRPVDGTHAMQRAAGAVVSVAAFGLGFLPAVLGTERRALHDRLAHTRVVTVLTR